MLPVIAGPDGHDHTVVPMPVGSSATADLTRLRVAYYTDNGILPATSETVTASGGSADWRANCGPAVRDDLALGAGQAIETAMEGWQPPPL